MSKLYHLHPRAKAPHLANQGRELSDVYRNPSAAKQAAFKREFAIFQEMGGRNWRITSHSCQFFCVAYEMEDEDGRAMLVHVTPSRRHAYYL